LKKITDERLHRQAPPDESSDPTRKIHKVNGNGSAGPILSSPAVRAALRVALQYPVFPCDGVTKEPLVKRGFYAATQDAAQIAKWWQSYPQALIGVPTGPASGLLAIDCDPKSGDWYARHKDRLGEYRLHQTRRGKHLLYQHVEGVGNSTSRVSEGVDVRGEGGYVIWWAAHGGEAFGTPGNAPEWLLKRVKSSSARKSNGANGHDTSGVFEDVPDGQRGDWLSARAYSLAKSGWSEAKILQMLHALSQQHCKPPKTEKELLRIVRGKRKFIAGELSAVVMKMSEIEEEAVDWLWKGFLARNKVHIIAGAGATMKSTLTLSMAATITRGGKWPDGTKCPRGNVILWTGEDDLGDTVKPRFRWSGGDQERCTVLVGVKEDETERAFDPAQDMGLLERVCEELGEVSLIIVDPIVVIVEKDNNHVNDVRRALLPLQRLAKKYHCVVLGIQHFNKGSKGKDPVERITGSGGWSQAPRIVLATAPIVDGEGRDPTKYVFTCIKTFAKKQKGGYEYGFEEEPNTEIARTAWGRYLDGTGLHIISEAEGNGDGESKLGIAKQFLRRLLEKGSVNVWEVRKQAEEAQVAGITLKRAKEELKIESMRVGKNAFRWRLPEKGD